MSTTRRATSATLLLILAAMLAACSTTPYQRRAAEAAAAKAVAATPTSVAELYVVQEPGRIVVFSQRAAYQRHVESGEPPQGVTRPGAGPQGETVVFALTPAEQPLGEAAPVIALYAGGATPPEGFYGELRRHGRIYVFDDAAALAAVRDHGHPEHSYVQIAAGPRGETVVYVLDAARRYQRPDALIGRFEGR